MGDNGEGPRDHRDHLKLVGGTDFDAVRSRLTEAFEQGLMDRSPHQVLDWLAQDHMALPDQGEPFVTWAAQSLGTTPERVRSMLRLSPRDRRRALYAKPTKLHRYRDEKVYPTTGWLGAYLLYTQESENPLPWHFWTAVALLSTTIRDRFYWDRRNYYLNLNHYVLMVGPTALTKSTVLNTGTDLLRRLNAMLTALAEKDRLLSNRELWVSPAQITPEKLMEVLSEREGHRYTPDGKLKLGSAAAQGLVVSDELVTLLGKTKKGSERMVGFLTDVYMGKPEYHSLTISNKDRKLYDVLLNCLFASTEEWIRTEITDSLFGGGTMGRFLVCYRTGTNRKMFEADPFDPVLADELALALIPWALNDSQVLLTWEPEAHRTFKEWYDTEGQDRPDDEKMLGFWRRKVDHIHKLAGLLAISDLVSGDPSALQEIQKAGQLGIGLAHLKQAKAVIEAEERYLPDLFAEIGADVDARDANRVFTFIKTCYDRTHRPVRRTTILQKVRPTIHARRLGYLLEGLEEARRIERFQEIPARGPAAMAYRPMDEDP